MKTIRVDLDEMTWHIRPSEQGAHVEVAYAFALTDDDSIVLRRTRDRSLGPSVSPRYHWRQYPARDFEPWNDDPAPLSGWRVARFAQSSASRRPNGTELQREIRAAVQESEDYNEIVHMTLPEAQRPFVVGILRRMGAEWTDLGVENALDAWHEDPATPDGMLWRIKVNFRGPADELV